MKSVWIIKAYVNSNLIKHSCQYKNYRFLQKINVYEILKKYFFLFSRIKFQLCLDKKINHMLSCNYDHVYYVNNFS